MLSTDVSPTVLSLIPIVSTPLGLYHVVVGSISAIDKSCRIAFYFFASLKSSKSDGGNVVREREVSKIKAKEGLYRAVETIVLGILEIIPFIGNLAIGFSKWRWIPVLEKVAESKITKQVEEQRKKLEEDFDVRVDLEACRQIQEMQSEVIVKVDLEEEEPECEVELASLQAGESEPTTEELLEKLQTTHTAYTRVNDLLKSTREELRKAQRNNSLLESTNLLKDKRIVELRKRAGEKSAELNILEKVANIIAPRK